MKELIEKIVNRPTYLRLLVLDAGKKIIIVATTKGFFLYDKDWKKVTKKDAGKLCDQYWFSHLKARFLNGDKEC